jgi:hypothetical protein
MPAKGAAIQTIPIYEGVNQAHATSSLSPMAGPWAPCTIFSSRLSADWSFISQ